MDKNKMTGYIGVALASAAFTFGVSWFALYYSNRDVINLGRELSVINECVDVLKEKEYPLQDGDVVQGAAQGYVSALAGDEYTQYIAASDDITAMTSYVNTSGSAIASGYAIDIADDGNILITEVQPGLAADKSGIRAGDVVTAIGGVSVKDEGYENIANKLLGKEGTEVTLTILRGGKESEVRFVRANQNSSSVEYERRDGYYYIGIKHLGQFDKGHVDEALTDAAGADKLIIDLRNCPGGDTDAATYICAQLVGHCKATFTDYKNKQTVIEYTFEPGLKGKKVVVLVNENTASAAELMTAGLMQSGMVKTVGATTFGKGIFQETVELSNGAQLRYTLGTYTVGDWECYQDVGIAPDVEVPMDSELIGTNDDIQLKKALELLD